LRQKQREAFKKSLSAGKKIPRGLSAAPSFRSNDSDSFRDVAPHQEFDLEHFGSGDLEPVALQNGQNRHCRRAAAMGRVLLFRRLLRLRMAPCTAYFSVLRLQTALQTLLIKAAIANKIKSLSHDRECERPIY
jgi:hypothetical protein